MQSLLEEIRKQPRMIRQVMFGSSVVIVVSLIGTVWFQSFERKLFVLMNPDEGVQEKYFAAKDEEDATGFAFVGKLFGGLSATVSNFFGASGEGEIKVQKNPSPSTAPARPLPLSEGR